MSPAEVSAAVRLRLAAELRADLGALRRRAASVADLATPKATESADAERTRTLALAFELERYYTAVEATLVRVMRALDGDAPGGDRWHTELLRAASVPIKGLRPAMVAPEIVADLRDLLGFRHLARHGYDVEPELPRLAVLAARVARVEGSLSASLAQVAAELEGTGST
jgi:hypothetical protein